VTATGDKALAARRDLLLQAYAAYNNQDVDVLLQLASDDVDWPDDSAGRLHGKRSGTRLPGPDATDRALRRATLPRRVGR
jgi:ketosteroid isomerase-like protein